ncbi:hypothetical protein l11_13130 [Neisseria weaveri LMG 5135]|nr:hypothetical protein l13_04620 [Neisseria weaveri ATCC 51223]EGV37210.1 hypothetical protein l11_13130 [Neisseria weaveri LMG 5135]
MPIWRGGLVGRCWPAIEDLSLDDFEGFKKEATRQIKAGYRKGI